MLSYLCIRSFRKLGTFAVGVFFDSSYPSCGRLSRPPTTTSPPPPQGGIGLSYGSRLPTSTVLSILPRASCVHSVRLKRDDLGGAFLMPLPLSAAPEIVCRVDSGLPAIPLMAFTNSTISGPTPPSLIWGFGSLADISGKVCQGRRLRWVATRRGLHKPVSSSPPFKTGLAAFTAPGLTPLVFLRGQTALRSVPSHFSSSTGVHPWTACAFAGYLCSSLSKG